MRNTGEFVIALAMVLVFTFVLEACGGGEDKCKDCDYPCMCIGGKCRCPDDVPVDREVEADMFDVEVEGEQEDIPYDEMDGLDGNGGGTDDVTEDVSDGEEEGEVCAHPCETDEDCDDGNICTRDECAPITRCCHYTNRDYLNCGDELFCNGYDYCYEGECVHEEPCTELGDCGPCAEPYCDEENDMCLCSPLPDGTSCETGDYCDGVDNICQDGDCLYENPCPDFTGSPCTMYECNEDTDSCVEVARPDGDPCHGNDDPCDSEFCMGGECRFFVPNCFDGDPCTQDNCDPATGTCSFPTIGGCTPCDPSECDDGDECTDDYCRIVDGVQECENIQFDPRCITGP